MAPNEGIAGSAALMPAEWEPHAATWIAWPHFHGDWPGKFEPIPWVYAEIVRNLARYERVEIIVHNAALEKSAKKTLQSVGVTRNVRFHRWKTDRVWTRDSGCTFVRRGPRLGATCWNFNAWAKYPNYHNDKKICELMAKKSGAQVSQPVFDGRRVTLEGGSIEVNGQGTLITTEECLLSKKQQRNPGMIRADYERVFAEQLGVTNVIWLRKGIAGDDTHGHVDDITRFVSPDTVVTAMEPNPKDSNYEPLRENIRRLRASFDQNGGPIATVDLPMPSRVTFDRTRLPASYANFYIANGVVLVPVFNDPNDRIALDILADLFPDRDVIPIYCGDLIWGFGAIHCMTQQQPAVRK